MKQAFDILLGYIFHSVLSLYFKCRVYILSVSNKFYVFQLLEYRRVLCNLNVILEWIHRPKIEVIIYPNSIMEKGSTGERNRSIPWTPWSSNDGGHHL